MKIDAIILAAGKSERMGENKLILLIDNISLITRTINAFLSVDNINKIIIATDNEFIIDLLDFNNKKIILSKGGCSRTQSVKFALEKSNSDYVLIHDGARPFVSKILIENIIEKTIINNSAIPILPITDSIRKVIENRIVDFVDRTSLFQVQTPQGFNTEQIKLAYKHIKNEIFTDDSEVYAKYIGKPYTVEGELSNKKITFPNDLLGINAKVGYGFDLHKLSYNRKLIIGGVLIPFEKGLVAHSDGDVLIHSIMDSLLGCANERDIGCHFPDNEEKYRDISSLILLKEVKNILNVKNININNISSCIIAQQPKINPYIPNMIENIANCLEIEKAKISISASTTEMVGNIGKGEAISAYTVCSCF